MIASAFIFDLDGVLTDTAEFHYQAWKRLADEQGLPFTREDNEALRGVSRRDSLLLLLKGKALPEETLQAWMARKNNYYLGLVAQMTPADLLPGVLPLLNSLRTRKIRIALGSASRNAPQVLGLLGIAGYFDVVADGGSVERQKPAPDLFLHAAAQLGLPPSACVVVEDAEAGVQAALAGGFRCIGIGPRERVGAAHLVIANLVDGADQIEAFALAG